MDNWLVAVDGMTGEQITKLVRKAQPDLQEKVKRIVLDYISETVTKLEDTDHSVILAIGDYNE